MKNLELSESGQVDVDELVRELRITKREFAIAIGLPVEAITRRSRKKAASTQSRLRELLQILDAVQDWTGSLSVAWSWYRSQPIPAAGNLTAEELVSHNRAQEVRAYLSQIAWAGYA